MNDPWWDLPGPTAFVARLVSDLTDGKNVILRLPTHPPVGLPNALRRRLAREELFEWRSLTVDAESASAPAEWLVRKIAPHEFNGRAITERTLAESRGLSGHVVWVDRMDPGCWGRWLPMLERYAHACQLRPETERMCLIVPLVGAVAARPAGSAVTLVEHEWRGRADRLDASLYASLLTQDFRGSYWARRLRVSVLTELAGPDVHAAKRLAGVSQRLSEVTRLDRLTDHLLSFGQERGWAGRPAAWDEGSLDTFEGGEFVHSAHLAANGAEREIRRRLWRAEVSVLFPLIEEHRVALLPQLPWLSRECDDAAGLEIGEIRHLLSSRRWPVGDRVFNQVQGLWRMRNELAHLRPVDPSEYLPAEFC